MGKITELLQQAISSGKYVGWEPFFREEMGKDYFPKLDQSITEKMTTDTVFPPEDKILTAFRDVAPGDVRVIILGQDPYHEKGQALGRAFAVPDNFPTPPSLKNIKKELKADIHCQDIPNSLEAWAQQGVFLLNTVLTVSEGKANSHANKGWESFTKHAILYVLNNNSGVVVSLLWGSNAQKFAHDIRKSGQNHLILAAPHPSPLSAYRGFFGSKPFSSTNQLLTEHGMKGIEWERQATSKITSTSQTSMSEILERNRHTLEESKRRHDIEQNRTFEDLKDVPIL